MRQCSTVSRTHSQCILTAYYVLLVICSRTQNELHALGNMLGPAGALSVRFGWLAKPLLLPHPVPRILPGSNWSHSFTFIWSQEEAKSSQSWGKVACTPRVLQKPSTLRIHPTSFKNKLFLSKDTLNNILHIHPMYGIVTIQQC